MFSQVEDHAVFDVYGCREFLDEVTDGVNGFLVCVAFADVWYVAPYTKVTRANLFRQLGRNTYEEL